MKIMKMVREKEMDSCDSSVGSSSTSEGELERKGQNLPLQQSSGSAIASLIFGCTEETFDECMRKRIFGFSETLLPLVQLVQPGMPVFLFNFEARKLFGIFEAESKGMKDIDPHAWTTYGSKATGARTNYPAQVRVKLVGTWIIGLEEPIFKEAIARNYFMPGRFYFHLDKQQTHSLIQTFNIVLHLKWLFPASKRCVICGRMCETEDQARWNNNRGPRTMFQRKANVRHFR